MKEIKDYLTESLNSDVQGSIYSWYRNYWKERLAVNRRVKYIKKALKRYKLSQADLGLLDNN